MYFLSSCVPLSVLSHRKTDWTALTYCVSHDMQSWSGMATSQQHLITWTHLLTPSHWFLPLVSWNIYFTVSATSWAFSATINGGRRPGHDDTLLCYHVSDLVAVLWGAFELEITCNPSTALHLWYFYHVALHFYIATKKTSIYNHTILPLAED